MFDFQKYKRVCADPESYHTYKEMSNALEGLISAASLEDIGKLCSYRAPVTIARKEYQRAISAGIVS